MNIYNYKLLHQDKKIKIDENQVKCKNKNYELLLN